MRTAFRDRTGERCGRLIVSGLSTRTEIRRDTGALKRFWNCICDCGNEVEVCADNLSGHTTSCGCYKAERIYEGTYKHGLIDTPEYWAWNAMRCRCYNTADKGYKNYGARGIVVCERWKDLFENFIADMGRKPSPKLTIERIDNDGNYCPENCKWGTRTEQARNRRNTRRLEHNGKNLTLAEWSEITGIDYFTIVARIKKGWTVSEVIETPHRYRKTI